MKTIDYNYKEEQKKFIKSLIRIKLFIILLLLIIETFFKISILKNYIYTAHEQNSNQKYHHNYSFYEINENGKNEIDEDKKFIFSFDAKYRTNKPNEKVTLINNVYMNFLRKIIINNNNLYLNYEYFFPEPGEHNVKVFLNSKKMNNTELMFYNINNLISINFSFNFFNPNIESIYGMFKNCINLEYVNFNNSFSKIKNFSYTFNNCISLISIDFSNIVSNEALNISYMFANCYSLKSIDLSQFDTINIIDMSGLFYYCSSLTTINLKSFKIQNVISMRYMFAECYSISYINLDNFEFKNVKDMSFMFKNCHKLTSIDLPNFENNNINKEGIFYGSESLKIKYDICIIGLWFAENYGSMATYYALHQAVKNMGYSILMIDDPTAPLRESKYEKCHPITIARALYNISEQKPLDKLYEYNNICKNFLLGSDQLWRPLLSRPFKQFFFLDFAKNNKKKIAYATSFGDPYDGTKEEEQITKINLNRFNAISVRDKLSLNITKKIFGINNVIEVCDPSFICNFSEYESLVNKSKIIQNTDYILAYILDPTKEKGHRLEKLSIDKNIPVFIIVEEIQNKWNLNKRKLRLRGKGKIEVKKNVDLNDFMWYFNHSKAVFTDSFHGTIFSIIFKKPFVTFKNDPRGGERFLSLLNPLNLSYRLFTKLSCINDRYDLYDSIDYTIPYQNLNIIKNFSYNWLKKVLKA